MLDTIPTKDELRKCTVGPPDMFTWTMAYELLFLKWLYLRNPEIEHDPYGMRPPFEENYCYGDVWKPFWDDVEEDTGKFFEYVSQNRLFALFPDTEAQCAELLMDRDFERFMYDTCYVVRDRFTVTPGLSDLLFAIAPVQPGATVLAACLQDAVYGAEVGLREPSAHVVVFNREPVFEPENYEPNAEMLGIARMETTGTSYEIAEPGRIDRIPRFDTGFANLTRQFCRPELPSLSDALASDSTFAASLASGATLVALVGSQDLYSQNRRDEREALLDAGLLRAVVTLADGWAGMKDVSLLVLGENPAGTVRLVDGAALAVKGWKDASLTREDAEKIAALVAGDFDDPVAVSVPASEIADAGWRLDPSWYLKRHTPVYPAVALADVTLGITRNPGLSQRELEELFAPDGPVEYLEVKNIDHHFVAGPLTRLKEVPAHLGRHLLQNGDVVLSRSGAPRSAVVDIDPDEKILPSGNLVVIRPDKTLVDPFYLSLYLASPAGQDALKLAMTSSANPVLSVKLLGNASVALPTLAQQDTICRHAGAELSRIKELQSEIAEKDDELAAYLADTIG
jgi:hypothetical protein